MILEIVEIEKPTRADLNQQALQAPLVGELKKLGGTVSEILLKTEWV